MSGDNLPTIWPISPHTAAKHAILRRHLDGWFPILASRFERLVYFDGFAGPGEYAGGEPGSPLVALQRAITQADRLRGREVQFLFSEEDRDRFEHLRATVAQVSRPDNFICTVLNAPFEQAAERFLELTEPRHGRPVPAFALIDPFGFAGVPMSLVRQFASHPHVEILVSLMVESIRRWHSKENIERSLTSLFGTEDWKVAGEATSNAAWFTWHDIYQNQLRSSDGFQYVRSFTMRGPTDQIKYFLMFATNSGEGLRQIKRAMWKADPTGAFTFSDATNPLQATMFDLLLPPDPAIQGLLLERFSGRSVAVELLEWFLICDPASSWLDTHLRSALRGLHTAGRITARHPDKVLKAGTFPAGTVIQF